MSAHRRSDNHSLFHSIKFYAVETAALIVFLVWLFTAVAHEVRSLWDSEFARPTHAAEPHNSCQTTLNLFRSD